MEPPRRVALSPSAAHRTIACWPETRDAKEPATDSLVDATQGGVGEECPSSGQTGFAGEAEIRNRTEPPVVRPRGDMRRDRTDGSRPSCSRAGATRRPRLTPRSARPYRVEA